MKEKIVFIEILRIIASFAVVMIHVTFQGYLRFGSKSNLNYLYFYNLCSFCVPIFVMITGALSLDKDKKFKASKIYRMLYILGIYGTCFSLMELVFTQKKFSYKLIYEAFLNVILEKSWAHLWYLYMLIGLYLIMPLLRVFYLNSSLKDIRRVIIILFIFNSLMPFLESIFKIEIGFHIPITGIYVFYLLIGRYIYESNIETNKWMNVLFFISLISIIVFAYLGISLTYENPITVLYGSMLFILMKKNNKHLIKIYKYGGNILSSTTFGIYIIHMVFLNFIYKYLKISPYAYGNPIILWCGITLIIFTGSFLVVLIIKRMPVLNAVCKL